MKINDADVIIQSLDAVAILERLKKASGLSTANEVAKLLGMDATMLSKWVNGKTRKAPLHYIIAYCINAKLSIDFILFGENNPVASIIPSLVYEQVQDGKSSNGKNDGLVPIEWIGIPRIDYSPEIFPYRQNGREMGDVIPDGSIVLVNREKRELFHGEIYLFKLHYAGIDDDKKYKYVIRRVEFKVGFKGIILATETKNGVEKLPAADFDPESVIGRIMFCQGRRYLHRDLAKLGHIEEEEIIDAVDFAASGNMGR